jgi:isocitrate lyase
MKCPMVIVARTDSLSAKLIDSNVDKLDHPFILGLSGGVEVTFPEAGSKVIAKNFSGKT